MLEKMKSIIAGQLNINEEDITLTSSFKEDLGADSLDLFEIVMAFEDEYDTEIATEELEKMVTVKDVYDYLQAQGITE